MEDFNDDFDDNFDDFEDEDSFEDEYDTEMDNPLDSDSDLDGEPDDAKSKDDDFTAKDAFIVGGAFGWGYEEGLKDRKRRKWKRFSDDSE